MTPPKGLCDMCRKRAAKFWFRDTSVALCGADECAERNDANWATMLEQLKADEEQERMR